MKKIYTLFFVLISTHAISQNSLSGLITGSNGLSNHYTEINRENRFPFAGSGLEKLLQLPAKAGFVLTEKFSDAQGYTYFRFYQTFDGAAVENSMCIVHTKTGLITGLAGSIITSFPNLVHPSGKQLSGSGAIEKALQFVNAEKYAWEDKRMESDYKEASHNATASYYPSPSLVWYNAGDEIVPSELKLCYKIDVYSLQPYNREYVFVNVETGNIMGTKQLLEANDATGTAATAYSGAQTVHSDTYNGSWRLRDLTKGSGMVTYHGENSVRGSDYTSTSANWNLTGADQYALDAHFGLASTYEFYLSSFSRNSMNGLGMQVPSLVNHPDFPDNATWDGSYLIFGVHDGKGMVAIDIVGHEFTHGVTRNTSKLNYSNESGAMNESMSDIMGKSVQFWKKPGDINWQHGNDMGYVRRSLSNPNAYGQPDTYHGSYWVSGTDDNGGVHTNSGVGNFMFYLLVNGGSGTNDFGNAYSVTGIGLAQADQIIYATETRQLTPTSQYADWRNACITEATRLYGAGSCQVLSVMNAWYAVGIGSAASYAMTGANIVCGASQVYNLTGFPSNAVFNWSVSAPVVGGYSYQLPLQTGVYTLATNGSTATITKNGSGNIHLAASVNFCGNTSYFGKDITLGTPTASNNGGYTTATSAKTISGTINTTDSKTPQVSMAFPSNNNYTFTQTGGTSNATWTNTGGGSANIKFNSPANSSTHIDFNITTSNTCGTQSSPVVFYYSGAAFFTVYPSPANNSITVSSELSGNNRLDPEDVLIKQVRIIDKAGNLRSVSNYTGGLRTVNINTSRLPDDVYYAHIYNGKEWAVQKFSVLH